MQLWLYSHLLWLWLSGDFHQIAEIWKQWNSLFCRSDKIWLPYSLFQSGHFFAEKLCSLITSVSLDFLYSYEYSTSGLLPIYNFELTIMSNESADAICYLILLSPSPAQFL